LLAQLRSSVVKNMIYSVVGKTRMKIIPVAPLMDRQIITASVITKPKVTETVKHDADVSKYVKLTNHSKSLSYTRYITNEIYQFIDAAQRVLGISRLIARTIHLS